MPLGLPRTECRLTGRDWEWCVAPPLLHASKLSPDLELFMPYLSLWSPWPLLQGEGHQVFVGYKDWPQVSAFVFYVTWASWWTTLSLFTVLDRSHCCQMGHWLPGQWWGLSGARIWVSGTKSRQRPWVTLDPLLKLCLKDAEATG